MDVIDFGFINKRRVLADESIKRCFVNVENLYYILVNSKRLYQPTASIDLPGPSQIELG